MSTHRTSLGVAACILASAASWACGEMPAAEQDQDVVTQTAQAVLASGISLTGSASLTTLAPDGFESISASLLLRNNTNQPVHLTRSVNLFATAGGFAFLVPDPLPSTGSFFGIGPDLSASSSPIPMAFSWIWSVPVTHEVHRLDGITPAGRAVTTLAALPVLRSGFAAPDPSPFGANLTVALQTPIEVVTLTSGERWLTIVGQAVDTATNDNNTVPLFNGTLKDSHGGVVAQVPLSLENGGPLWPFFGVVSLGSGASPAALDVAVEFDRSGGTVSARGHASVVVASPIGLSPPISGRWLWHNGQGESFYHTHFQFPEQRYAYDILIQKTVNGVVTTFAGDPSVNQSYFDFGKPIRAALDGTVVEVVDDVTDNDGDLGNNNPGHNNTIVIQHAGGLFTLYDHARRGSPVVRVGQRVRAGDLIAQVGNAGFSTEPHLHFSVFKLDASGRVRALAMAPRGLHSTAGPLLAGVPKGGLEYVSP